MFILLLTISDVLPVLFVSLESNTHSLVNHALQILSVVLPILDFSTIKNELFPVVANVFAKTSSMAIKIQGLHALNSLCGGSSGEERDFSDGLDGVKAQPKSNSSSAMLDKFTIQEKVVPLLRAIKTKEPAVMMAALAVFKQVGKVADADFLALEVLPCLWSLTLGPLLNLGQFQDFMQLIKSISTKIEQEQTRKLSELSAHSLTAKRAGASSFGGISPANGVANDPTSNEDETDFESLVTGRGRNGNNDDLIDGGWGVETSSRPTNLRNNSTPQSSTAPRFSWQTAPGPSLSSGPAAGQQNRPGTGSVTPDSLSSFMPLSPSQTSSATAANPWGQSMQPMRAMQSPPSVGSTPLQPSQPHRPNGSIGATTVDWSSASKQIGSSINATTATMGAMQSNKGSLQTVPANNNGFSNFSIAPPPSSASGMNVQIPSRSGPSHLQHNNQSQKQGLDKYESLI